MPSIAFIAAVAQASPPPKAGDPFDALNSPASKWLVLWIGLSPFALAMLIIWTRRRFRRK